MANHILAIHLSERRASIAVAEATLRSRRITTLAEVEPGSPQAADIISERKWDRVLATVPGDGAAFRMLDLPFSDRRKLALAVGPALEDYVPLDLENSVTAFDHASTDAGTGVLAVMAEREGLDAQRAKLSEIGLEPDRLSWAPTATLAAYRHAVGTDAAFVAVDVSEDGAVVGAFDENGLVGMRVLGDCDEPTLVRNIAWSIRTLDPPSDRIVCGGSRMQTVHLGLAETLTGSRFEALPTSAPIEMPHHLETGWRQSAVAVGLVLAGTSDISAPRIEFATGDGLENAQEMRSAARTLAPWAAAAGILFAVAWGFDLARLSRTSDSLNREAERIYRSAMPTPSGGIGRLVKMELRARELEQRRAEASGSHTHASPLGVLLSMSSSIPRELEIEFDRYLYDAPNVRLSGQGASFETVTRLQQLLESQGRFRAVEVSDVHSAVSGDGVEFEMTIVLDAETAAGGAA